MTLLEKYTLFIPTIENVNRNNPSHSLSGRISLASLSTYIPCIEMCEIFKELYGDSEELQRITNKNKEFYRV